MTARASSRGVVAALPLAMILAGCGSLAPVVGGPGEGLGGIGVPQQLDGESYPGRQAEMDTTVWVADDGCVYLLGDQPRLAIWPAGSELSNPVRLPDGTELADGQEIGTRGRILPAEDLPGGMDGYWAHVTGFCDDGADVFVIDEIDLGG